MRVRVHAGAQLLRPRARAAAARTPMPITRARQTYAHPHRCLRPGRPPAAAAPGGNPAMHASTRPPYPARVIFDLHTQFGEHVLRAQAKSECTHRRRFLRAGVVEDGR